MQTGTNSVIMAGLIAIMAIATFASIMTAAPSASARPEGFDDRCFPRSDPANREGNTGNTHDAEDQRNPHDDQLGFTKGNPHDECV
jgi:hypothetical protein